MRNFLRNSFLLSFSLLAFSCSKNIYSSGGAQAKTITASDFVPVFPPDTTVIYKTGVSAYGHYLSGLLLIKTGKAEDTRLIFTTETGIKLFDFEFVGDAFINHYCMKKLNKKVVVNLLKQDLALMLGRGVVGKQGKISLNDSAGTNSISIQKGKEARFYSVSKDVALLQKVKTFSLKGKEKVLILFQREEDIVPSKIVLEHSNLNLNMKLDLIKR